MKILEVLTYYRPWASGLTIYVEWLGAALTRLGHDVTVLTSQYSRELPRYDVMDGVKVVRVPVAMRISKGVVMPGFGPMAWKLAQDCEAIHLHLPQFDAPGIALRGRLLGKPVVLTYHCDLRLPSGNLNRIADRVVQMTNRVAGELSDAIVTYTRDYAESSAFLSSYLGGKLRIIAPPVRAPQCTEDDFHGFQERHRLYGRPTIGISARLATEKGIEVLLRALPLVLEAMPDAIVLHAGMNANVIGEEAYAMKLLPLMERHASNYRQLGHLEGAAYGAFHRSLDCLVVCSLNSTESFGLVQIEAMMNGTPVVASDLPGVREAVRMTAMGELFPAGDHEALASAIIRVLRYRPNYIRSPAVISDCFSPESSAAEYLDLFREIAGGSLSPGTLAPAAYTRLRALRERAPTG